jgi:hypothetical protein
LYRSFIGDGPPPKSLVPRYEEALRELEIPEHRPTSLLVAAQVRLSGAEFVLRLREPSNGLTRRALILTTLAESMPDELPQEAPLRAWLTLCTAPLAAAWRYLVGAWQLWWYVR